MQVIDSNILLSIARSEQNAQQAKEILQSSQKNIVIYAVLSEVFTVLRIRESYEKAISVMQWIIEDPMFEIQQESKDDFINTIYFLQQHETPLSFVDTQLLIISKNKNIPLRTFDKALQQEYERR